jgi:hypothetical protein
MRQYWQNRATAIAKITQKPTNFPKKPQKTPKTLANRLKKFYL